MMRAWKKSSLGTLSNFGQGDQPISCKINTPLTRASSRLRADGILATLTEYEVALP